MQVKYLAINYVQFSDQYDAIKAEDGIELPQWSHFVTALL